MPYCPCCSTEPPLRLHAPLWQAPRQQGSPSLVFSGNRVKSPLSIWYEASARLIQGALNIPRSGHRAAMACAPTPCLCRCQLRSFWEISLRKALFSFLTFAHLPKQSKAKQNKILACRCLAQPLLGSICHSQKWRSDLSRAKFQLWQFYCRVSFFFLSSHACLSRPQVSSPTPNVSHKRR